MTSMQIKSLIRNMAKEKNINAQILLRNYMLERLLERISKSKYKDNFVLKGGMLVASMVGIDTRSTIDLDATLKNFPLTKEKIISAFENILSTDIDDNITIELLNVMEIREEADYHGFRLSLLGKVDESRIPLKVDITTGDKITPRAIKYSFKLLLEDRNIEVLAEKLESVISRATENTRMRDFYDIYILTKLQSQNIDLELFKQALKATAENRGSAKQLERSNEILNMIGENLTLEKLWKNYVAKNSYAKGIQWKTVIESVSKMFNDIN